MAQPVAEITRSESDRQPRPPQPRMMSISSGPMSQGMIPSVRAEDGQIRKSESAEHICMFSLCLMFVGVPIILIGILCLTIATPFGLIVTLIGAGASASGAFLVTLSGIIALCKLFIKPKPKADYGDGQPPEIIIDDTIYSEDFADNLCEEQPDRRREFVVDRRPSADLADLPSMERLDPVNWSNYPEAQNPKSYLNSFGELPKIVPSPDIRCSSVKRKSSRFSKKSKKSGKKIGRKISQSLGMGPKRKTLSKTSLTRDFSEEIQSDFSSSSPSSTSSGRSTRVVQNNRKVNANGFAVNNNNNNQSIITIENVGNHLANDCNEEEELTTIVVNNDKDFNHSSDQTSDESVDNNSVTKEQNKLVVNCILPDECTDSIELTEIGDRDAKDRYIIDEEFENYSDIWNSIRSTK